jgi:hypothetical protein
LEQFVPIPASIAEQVVGLANRGKRFAIARRGRHLEQLGQQFLLGYFAIIAHFDSCVVAALSEVAEDFLKEGRWIT